MMFNTRLIASGKILLVCTTALSLAACESAGSYRVASVGTVPGGGSGTAAGDTGNGDGTTGSGGSSGAGAGGTGATGGGAGASSGGAQGGILVTAGNAVIGVAGKQSALTNATLLPTVGKVSGVVTAVLTKTGQTLVNLGSGQSLILNGTGKLGELVKIDLGTRTVIGASTGSSLLGIGVLSASSATGKLAAVNVANAGPLLTVGGASIGGGTGTNGALTPVTAIVNGVVASGSTTGALAPVSGTLASVTSTGSGTGLVAGVGGALGLTATPG